MDSEYKALKHFTNFSKAFVFLTSQLEGKEIVGEYFILLIDDQGNNHTASQLFHGDNDVVRDLICPHEECDDEDYIECVLDEMEAQAKERLSQLLSEIYCPNDKQYIELTVREIVGVNSPSLTELNLVTMAWCGLQEKDYKFVYNSRNKQLKDFLQNLSVIVNHTNFIPIKSKED